MTWRCDPAGIPRIADDLPALALGFRAARLGQTGRLSLIIGRKTVWSTVIQPDQMITLPFRRAPVQRLRIVEGGENGTLRATVTVAFVHPFVSGYCRPYMPPRVDVHLTPRR